MKRLCLIVTISRYENESTEEKLNRPINRLDSIFVRFDAITVIAEAIVTVIPAREDKKKKIEGGCSSSRGDSKRKALTCELDAVPLPPSLLFAEFMNAIMQGKRAQSKLGYLGALVLSVRHDCQQDVALLPFSWPEAYTKPSFRALAPERCEKLARKVPLGCRLQKMRWSYRYDGATDV